MYLDAGRHPPRKARTPGAAELRRLQDGGAHLVRGYDNFAVYAEQTFDGLTAAAAKQISRQGGVLLTLERHGRIDLERRSLPVASTALRALSVVANSFGESAMLAVYDRALELRPGRAIVEQTVKGAMRELGARTTPPPAIAAAPDIDAAAGTEDDLEAELVVILAHDGAVDRAGAQFRAQLERHLHDRTPRH